MAMFSKGQVVKLKAIIPSGPVEKMRMDDDGNVQYLVQWEDIDGVVQERWFDEAQLVAG